MKQISDILYKFEESKEDNIIRLHQLIHELQPYINDLTNLRDEMVLEDDDWRNGFDTYGYSDIDQISGQLSYISDRWKATFRINWLIGLINPDDYLHAEAWAEQGYEKTVRMNRINNG